MTTPNGNPSTGEIPPPYLLILSVSFVAFVLANSLAALAYFLFGRPISRAALNGNTTPLLIAGCAYIVWLASATGAACLLTHRVYLSRSRAARLHRGQCPRCGYQLSDATPHCPECGPN